MGTRSKTHAFRKSRVLIDRVHERNRTLGLSVGFASITILVSALVVWVVSWWRGLG